MNNHFNYFLKFTKQRKLAQQREMKRRTQTCDRTCRSLWLQTLFPVTGYETRQESIDYYRLLSNGYITLVLRAEGFFQTA